MSGQPQTDDQQRQMFTDQLPVDVSGGPDKTTTMGDLIRGDTIGDFTLGDALDRLLERMTTVIASTPHDSSPDSRSRHLAVLRTEVEKAAAYAHAYGL